MECVPCAKGTYTLVRGYHDIWFVNNTDFDTVTWKNDRPLLVQGLPREGKCLLCPPGGNCSNGIKSQGNYYGLSQYSQLYDHSDHLKNEQKYAKKSPENVVDNNKNNSNKNDTRSGSPQEYPDDQIKPIPASITISFPKDDTRIKRMETVATFLPCPPGYCCSNLGQPCTNITSCNYNRRGILCGACMDGFFESYFSTDCVAVSKCTQTNRHQFWTGNAFFFLIIILLLQYLRTVWNLTLSRTHGR